jgi:NhaP-type Na+/H+ or K+/H+ antiporter
MDLRESDQKMKPIVLLLLAAAVISVIGSTGVAYAAEGDAAGSRTCSNQ